MSKSKNPAFAMWEKRASSNTELPDIARLAVPSASSSTATNVGYKIRKAKALERVEQFSPKMTAKKVVVTSSLADRMKKFSENDNGTIPFSFAGSTNSNKSAKAYQAEEAKKKRAENSKKRHELRKKNQEEEEASASTSAKRTTKRGAPVKQHSITAARVNLDQFVPPTYPKSDADAKLLQEALRQNFVFENLNESDETKLTQAFEKMQVHEGQKIINQGDTGDYFYVIAEGAVRFEVNGKGVGKSEAGKSFGELSLLYTSPRAASVIAQENPTVLFRVDQKTFRYVMETKAKESENEKMGLLKKIGFLKDFKHSDLTRLCDCMVPRNFEKDEVVVTKGEEGDLFYILKEGLMKVTDISVGGTAYEDVTLSPGDYFGERALLLSEPRAANVVGMQSGSCFVIDRFTFEKVLGSFSQVIMRSQDRVKLEGVKTIKDAGLEGEVLDKLVDVIIDREFEAGENIQEKGKETEAALYLIHEGTVNIMSTDIGAGGYFGDEQLLADAQGQSNSEGFITAEETVTCSTDVVCGVLTLKECRLLMDTKTITTDFKKDDYEFRSSAILKRRSTMKETFQSKKISMEELDREKMLGEGAFGEVWLVKADIWGLGDDEYKEEFALKVQNLDNPEHANMRDTIKREMEVISTLEHPFIVDLVSCHETETESMMLMTVVKGGELWNVVHKEQDDGEWLSGISEEDTKFYSLIIADTLAYMHYKNILFRDLKPENILIDRDGYPNIIDFGFAKFCKDKTYTFCGTPNYVAPEIVLSQGHGAGVDHWALGVTIYEMIAGENPFYYEGVDTGTLFQMIAKEEPYPCEKASADAMDLINGLLEKDPTQRLGGLAGKERDILNHKWFEDLDLEMLRHKLVDAPWNPPMPSGGDD
ncbi:unnamed protein product [Cylindrotheca closterium]|uniref:cGMP-dependent protein kinase n=1 Tax=Cylindrotheca closterium TaxID=2856 RepID=A0AAD2CE05_9STRA|nr:unnamed protein product [Cylindrotheca closterium]